eukprot:gene145-biopygen5613
MMEEAPVMMEEAPVMMEEAPVMMEEAPVMMEEAPVMMEEAPVMEEEVRGEYGMGRVRSANANGRSMGDHGESKEYLFQWPKRRRLGRGGGGACCAAAAHPPRGLTAAAGRLLRLRKSAPYLRSGMVAPDYSGNEGPLPATSGSEGPLPTTPREVPLPTTPREVPLPTTRERGAAPNHPGRGAARRRGPPPGSTALRGLGRRKGPLAAAGPRASQLRQSARSGGGVARSLSATSAAARPFECGRGEGTEGRGCCAPARPRGR